MGRLAERSGVKYLLDSNIVILTLAGLDGALRRRLAACDEGEVAMSTIVYAEVALGSASGKPPPPETLRDLIEEVPVLPFDHAAARAYAGLPFRRGSFDRLIAAHALSLDLTLVTDNVAHFADVPGLKLEDWASQ